MSSRYNNSLVRQGSSQAKRAKFERDSDEKSKPSEVLAKASEQARARLLPISQMRFDSASENKEKKNKRLHEAGPRKRDN